MQRILLPVLLCGALCGCDFTVPLVESPEGELDDRLIGLWERTRENDQKERLLVLPLGPHEYLAAYPLGGEAMVARAAPFLLEGRMLVQLRWIGTAGGKTPDDDRVYQIAAAEFRDEQLLVRLLDPETVGRDFDSTEELAGALKRHAQNPAAFRDALAFTRVEE